MDKQCCIETPCKTRADPQTTPKAPTAPRLLPLPAKGDVLNLAAQSVSSERSSAALKQHAHGGNLRRLALRGREGRREQLRRALPPVHR